MKKAFRIMREQFSMEYTCLMGGAIQFNNAMFHIFSGPLFANLQGYVYLDLLIWGVSPLAFWIIRPHLAYFIKPIDRQRDELHQRDENHKHHQRHQHKRPTQMHPKNIATKKRFCTYIVVLLIIWVSFLFMNYSQSFNWNYFSRVINLDFGYLLFDFGNRAMLLLVQIQEQQQKKNEIKSMTSYLSDISWHQAGYCRFKNIAMILSYFTIFYLSISHDINSSTTTKHIFKYLSIASCIATLFISIVYFLRHRSVFQLSQLLGLPKHTKYNQIQSEEEENNQKISIKDHPIKGSIASDTLQRQIAFDTLQQQIDLEDTNDSADMKPLLSRTYWSFLTLNFSYLVNTSYFSLWVMEGLKSQKSTSFQQFNKSVFSTATFFLIGSFLQFVIAQTYIGFSLGYDSDYVFFKKIIKNQCFRRWMVKIMLILYGSYFIYTFWLSEIIAWHAVLLLIIPFGFHLVLCHHISHKLDAVQNAFNDIPASTEHEFYIETFAYLILPILLNACGLSEQTLWIYGCLSGLSLVISAFVIE